MTVRDSLEAVATRVRRGLEQAVRSARSGAPAATTNVANRRNAVVSRNVGAPDSTEVTTATQRTRIRQRSGTRRTRKS